MRLQEWENYLRPYLSKIELLGEIPLEQAQHLDLERALGEFIRKYGLTKSARLLKEIYPAAFVTYLAFKAAFNDEQGFWDRVKQDLDIPQAQLHSGEHHWGLIFLEIVSAHPNLRQFYSVPGYRYLTPIRLHGGIPAFSLPDFFCHILLPSVEKAPYDGMDDKAVLDALLKHYTAELYVDSIVRYFFKYGGEHALRFFQKCRHMARLAQTNQPLPAPAALGIRPYVVQAFENFQVSHSTPTQRPRPRLYFDPYGPGLRVTLPPQPLSLDKGNQRYEARIYNDETGEVYAAQTRLRPRRKGQDWILEEVSWILEEPLEIVRVGVFIQDDEQPLYDFPLRLLPRPGYPPLLAFRHENQRQVSLASSLPAKNLWLLYPSDAQVAFEGPARLLQSLPTFAPPWQDWQAAAWDLSEARLLRLLRDGQDVCPPIPVSRTLEPYLLPSDLPTQVLATDEKPLYSAAPRVCVPLRNPEIPQEELAAWTLRLESRSAAAPQGTWRASASVLPYIIEGNAAHILLEPWLGDAPFGTYHLAMEQRGRLVSELLFRVCAGLRVEGLQSYYLPERDGAREITFTITLPVTARLQAEDDTRISPIPQDNGFTLSVPREASQADLRVHIPGDPEVIQIPLRIAISRLRWAVALQKGAALEWAHQPISRPLAELLQSDLVIHRPRLRLELPITGAEKPLIALHLTAPGRERLLQTSESRSLSSHWLEFDLSAFFDTLRAHPDESVFEFYLEWLDAERELNLHLPVLRLSRDPDIRVCYFEATPSGGWRLHWYEPRPLRHRRLWLWSRWQPWADPIEIHLPDDAPRNDSSPVEGWWMHDLPEDISLPPSEYRAQFVVVSPYEINPPPPFPPRNAIEIRMVVPEELLRQINDGLRGASPARAFALHFENLCIHHDRNHGRKKQEEIRWLLEHWREASLLHLEALVRWLKKYDVEENCRAFLMHMFREETLKRLEEEHHPPAFIQKYLRNVLDARTIRPESVRRVIKLSNDPEVILYVLRILLKSDEEEARSIFWSFLKEGKFSEDDAASLLKKSPDFARHLLVNTPPSPMRKRLLLELARWIDLPEYVVKTGYYVLSDVGWGKIVEVRGAEHENLFFPDEEAPALRVELLHWPGQNVEIDLNHRQVTLLNRNAAYRCGCERFTALRGKQTLSDWQHHQALCGYHSEMAVPSPFALHSTILYCSSAPLNPLDTRPGD